MTAQTSVYGRLVADPTQHQTKTGTAMTTARLAVDLPCKDDAEGKATWWVSVLAFGRQAELLAGHQKSDMLSASGTLQMNRWTAQDGSTRETHQLMADSLISARTVRPGRKAGSQQQAPSPQQGTPTAFDNAPPPFDDDMGF